VSYLFFTQSESIEFPFYEDRQYIGVGVWKYCGVYKILSF